MARSKRYHYPGCFYHVMLRGNHGQDIFFSDIDLYILRVFQKWEFLEFRKNKFKLGYADTECEVY